jgi:hypothetical protein
MATDWYEIIDHKDPARLGVNATTVTVLQGLCPRFREEDRAIICTSMDEKILFPDAKNWKQRNKIRDRICHFPRTIPSFEIFLTQCEVLRLGAPILQDLLSGRPWKEPLFPAFSAWAVQIEANDESGRFSHRAVYCQLWLFVIRKLFAGSFLPALLRQDLAASVDPYHSPHWLLDHNHPPQQRHGLLGLPPWPAPFSKYDFLFPWVRR